MLSLPNQFLREPMNSNSGTCKIVDITLSPNAVISGFVNSRSKQRPSPTKIARDVLEFAKEDTSRMAFAIKFGLAMLLISLLILTERPFQVLGTNVVWSILTVGIMFEYTVGTTLYRGVYRAVGSLLAGIFAVFVIGTIMISGRPAEPYLIAANIFLVGAATSLLKQWPSLAPYEYGFRVTLFTFCLIVVSTFRMSNPIWAAVERLYSIAIGAVVAAGVNVFVFPAWAGEQLHKELVDSFYSVAESLEDCVSKYLTGDGLEHTNLCKAIDAEFNDDPACRKYRSILNSSARFNSLANSAKWEPPHGRFRHSYGTWSEYVKVGAVLRHCAYAVAALCGCLRSEIQAPYSLRISFQEEILDATTEAAALIRSLANDISSMERSHQVSHLKRVHLASVRLQRSIDVRSYLLTSSRTLELKGDAQLGAQHCSYHEAMRQQKRLRSWPSREADELEGDGGGDKAGLIARMSALQSTKALSLATFTMLLIEFVDRLDHLADAVGELVAAAAFKQKSST